MKEYLRDILASTDAALDLEHGRAIAVMNLNRILREDTRTYVESDGDDDLLRMQVLPFALRAEIHCFLDRLEGPQEPISMRGIPRGDRREHERSVRDTQHDIDAIEGRRLARRAVAALTGGGGGVGGPIRA